MLKNNVYKDSNEIFFREKEKILFKELPDFFKKFNNEQKRAIISEKDKIICIAGAGSGKTSVLTKRIEFLIKYKSVDPKKVLSITFTKKARQEMQERLEKAGIKTHIHTFNSFSEKILKIYGGRIYNKPTQTINYSNKIMILMSVLNSLGVERKEIIDTYFENSWKPNKTEDELFNIFIKDCFMLLDYFKRKKEDIYDFSKDSPPEHRKKAKLIYDVCNGIQKNMELMGLRDFTDQIVDTINFFKKNPDFIPKYDYIFIDEYQDVNKIQIELINLLNPKNLFCVGDPRQAIFGWRGSDIKFIFEFNKKYPEAEVIYLTKNYRSTNHIVELMNLSIEHMNLPNLNPTINGEKHIYLKKFNDENEEFNFIIEKILKSDIPKNEIFVLSRTNKKLEDLSYLMKQKGIAHKIKINENETMVLEDKNRVTLSTIHSIKGLEAEKVFVIGVDKSNFPSKTSDNPIIELIKSEDYDKFEEEKRLFYVAISRAKKKLYLTYSKNEHTDFINFKMLNIIESDINNSDKFNYKRSYLKENFEEEIENDFYNPINLDGNAYPEDYNPYEKEGWEDMIN